MSDEEREKEKAESLQLTEAKIKREVYRVGKKVFLLFSIAPAIYTIYFLFFFIPSKIQREMFPTFQMIFKYQIRSPLILLILSWLVVILGITIPAMIGKRLLFTEKKKQIFLMPVMTFAICVILGIIVTIIFESL